MDSFQFRIAFIVFIALLAVFFFYGSESATYESYDKNTEHVFLTGDSQFEESDKRVIKDIKQKLPFSIFDQDPKGNIVSLSEGSIQNSQIENEKNVHVVEAAGEESDYDFYAGTYDNGYLVGGLVEQDTVKYDIIDQLDDRVRELSLGDVTGNEEDELVVTTHFDGITAVYNLENWEKDIIDRAEYGNGTTYSHDVEVGNITGEDALDIVTTPSEPNTWEEEQKGVVKLHRKTEEGWEVYRTDELDESHIRKIAIDNQNNVIIAGVIQRDKPYEREASLIKYGFGEDGLEKQKETFLPDIERVNYPFIVEREENNLVVALSSGGAASIVDTKDLELLYTERFTYEQDLFYVGDTFDYNGDGQEEIAIVREGDIGVYQVDEEEMVEKDNLPVYKDFDSITSWSLETLNS